MICVNLMPVGLRERVLPERLIDEILVLCRGFAWGRHAGDNGGKSYLIDLNMSRKYCEKTYSAEFVQIPEK